MTPGGYHTFFDEGSTLHAAQRLADGEQLYSDLLYFKGPLSYYGLALIFICFGPGLAQARLSGAALVSLVLVLSFCLAWRIRPREACQRGLSPIAYAGIVFLLAGALIIQRVSWHNSWCAAALSLAAILACLWAEKKRRPMAWILSGLLVGLAFLTKQSFGLCLFGGVVFHRILLGFLTKNPHEARFLIPWLKGVFLALAGWALFALIAGNLRDFLYLTIIYPLTAKGLVSGLAHSLPPVVFGRETLLFYGFPLLLLALAVHAGCRTTRGSRSHRILFAYSVLALCVYGALFPRSDMGHLRPLLPIALPALLYVADNAIARIPGWWRVLPVLALAGMFAVFLDAPLVLSLSKGVPLSMERGLGVKTDPETTAILNELVEEIQARTLPGEAIFVVPWAPLVYLLADRPNPTRVRIIWPGQWDSRDYQLETIRDLEKARVRTIIRVQGLKVIHQQDFAQYASLVHGYIGTNYTSVKAIGRFEILDRKQAG
ncbi:MAG: glycosyltransferase family 39 protein [Desulfatibacillum sp.]|nr:glycosyltransferase family 39 protein [Desulfatibacillum sp.]